VSSAKYVEMQDHSEHSKLLKGSSSSRTLVVIITTARLPSNLRPTTRECVHLVMHGHFRSRDKDGDRTVAIADGSFSLHK